MASLASGCGGHHVAPVFNPPLPTANTPIYGIAVNTPTVLVDASQPGYAITANVGNSYRAVWTGNATFSAFRGYIIAQSSFTSVTIGCSDGSCPLESGDVITRPYNSAGGGQRIDFDTLAADGLDGLDFTLDSADQVYFYMEVNDTYRPDLVYFTSSDVAGQVSNPASMPFALTTH
jgi:hypothetical protein